VSGAAWLFCGACAIGAVALVVFGAVRAYLVWGRLQRRIDGYGDLPVLRAVRDVQQRVTAMNARLQELDPLMARARAAIETISAGLARFKSLGILLQTTAKIATNAGYVVRDSFR